jgi:hypothetical protein
LRAVQIVAPRSIIACAKSPARSAGVIASAAARIALRAAGSGSSISHNRATTRSTLASIYHRALAEGDRRDRGRGVGAQSGQLAQGLLAVGKPAPLRHGARAGDQVAARE